MASSVERDYILGEAIDFLQVNTIFWYILYAAIQVYLLNFLKIFLCPPTKRLQSLRLVHVTNHQKHYKKQHVKEEKNLSEPLSFI